MIRRIDEKSKQVHYKTSIHVGIFISASIPNNVHTGRSVTLLTTLGLQYSKISPR